MTIELIPTRARRTHVRISNVRPRRRTHVGFAAAWRPSHVSTMWSRSSHLSAFDLILNRNPYLHLNFKPLQHKLQPRSQLHCGCYSAQANAPRAKFQPGEIVCHLWAAWHTKDGGRFMPEKVGGKNQLYRRAEWYRGTVANDPTFMPEFTYAGKLYFNKWCYYVH